VEVGQAVDLFMTYTNFIHSFETVWFGRSIARYQDLAFSASGSANHTLAEQQQGHMDRGGRTGMEWHHTSPSACSTLATAIRSETDGWDRGCLDFDSEDKLIMERWREGTDKRGAHGIH